MWHFAFGAKGSLGEVSLSGKQTDSIAFGTSTWPVASEQSQSTETNALILLANSPFPTPLCRQLLACPPQGGIRRGGTSEAPPEAARGGVPPNGTPCHIQHSPGTPTTGLRERGNDTSRSTGRSGRQNAATRRNMRREEWLTVQGPVKEQQPDGMSHRGVPPPLPMHPWGGGGARGSPTYTTYGGHGLPRFIRRISAEPCSIQ